MNNFISLAFWFNSRPEILSDTGQKVLVAIATILGIIALVVVLRAYAKSWSIYRPTLERLVPFSVTNAIISLYFVFLNDQIIPVLRAHYWYVIWVAVAIAWLISIILSGIKRAKRKEILSQEADKKKYLPH